MSYKVLIADDESIALETAKYNLADLRDIELTTASSALETLKILKANPVAFAVIVVDFNMPDKDGATLIKEILAVNPKSQIIVYSGDYSREALKRSYDAGASDFLEKEISPDFFRLKIEAACKKWEETVATFQSPTPDENSSLISKIKMVGRSRALAELSSTVQLAANSSCNVLIHGESGTGKELVARALHEQSARKNQAFVPINVAAIPDNLIESDLFGHMRGAFTGAERDKMGKIELANKGTVFLDEIGDLKPELQVKLLRFLQEGEIHPVGGHQPKKVDVKIIAASHVNLEEAVAKGKFREDLFYRLNVVKLVIPPLRSRPEDIQPMVAHFQNQFGGEKKSILMKTIRYLERYPWPGNVRELENEMERLMTMVPSDSIEPTHLSTKFFQNITGSPVSVNDFSYSEFIAYLEQMERDYLLANLAKGGTVRESAKHWMKAPYTTIYGRIKKLNLINSINGGGTNEEAIL